MGSFSMEIKDPKISGLRPNAETVSGQNVHPMIEGEPAACS